MFDDQETSELIALYISLRDDNTALKRDVDAKIALHKEAMDAIEAELLTRMTADGLTSVRTDDGTAFVQTTQQARLSDWSTFYDFVRTHDCDDLLQKRISSTATLQYIKDHGEVPGTVVVEEVSVGFRKPSAKYD